MRFYSDIELTGDAEAVRSVLNSIDPIPGSGWKRVPEVEQQLTGSGQVEGVIRCYTCMRSSRRADAILCLNSKVPGAASISKIIALSKEHLSYEEHNIIAKEFYERFARPAAEEEGVQCRFLEANVEVRQCGFPSVSVQSSLIERQTPLSRSPGLARALHPMDEEKLMQTISSVRSEEASPGSDALGVLLRQFKNSSASDKMKDLLYALAQDYESKNNLVDAHQIYKGISETDIGFKNVKEKTFALETTLAAGRAFDKTVVEKQLSEKACRRYELMEELGRGAMGIVYKAKDNELDEIVALKILPENLSQNPEALQRFRVEARAARKLSHPNIVRIHDIGEDAGRKYISMEFVDGGDLKRLYLECGRFTPRELVHIMGQVAMALDYAHSIGIVHRDIKPANILITGDLQVKISDFGIAKILQSTAETMTATGSIMGTPLYMSPEQLQGLPVDNRADIYSLGIMMYELVSGNAPFTSGDIAYQHVHVPPKPIEDIPAGLNDVIVKCLAKKKEDRWVRAGEIAKAMDQLGELE